MPNKVERFTNRSRLVLKLSQEDAEKFQDEFIGTAHLLLGMLREERGIAEHVLRDLGLELRQVNEWVKRLTKRPPLFRDKALDLTQDVKDVLYLSVDEARRMGNTFVGTEHLLLGLVRQSNSAAIEALRDASITPEQVRRRTRLILEESYILTGDLSAETLSAARRMASRGLEITEAELLLLNGSDLVEVVDGVVVSTDSNRFAHGVVPANLYNRLRTFTQEHDLGYVALDNLIYVLLKENNRVIRSRIPDISFIRKARLSGYDFSGMFPGAPDLAVEIVTRFKSQYSVFSKIRDYFAHGTEEVSVIHLAQQQVCLYSRDDPSAVKGYKIDDVLESALFPGLAIPVRDLFGKPE